MAALEDRVMPIGEHLEELRRRLIVSLLAISAGAALTWSSSGEILRLLSRPVGNLIFIAPTEAFFTRLKLSFFGGLLLTLPIVLYQVWAFTACAMGGTLRRILKILLPMSYILFLGGVALSVFVVVPAAMRFFIASGSSSVRPLLAVGAYVDFVTQLALAFGLIFQTPLVLVALNHAGIVSRLQMRGMRRAAYVGAFIIAGLLTPGPDVFSQITLAFSLLTLFEGSLWVMR